MRQLPPESILIHPQRVPKRSSIDPAVYAADHARPAPIHVSRKDYGE